MVTHASRSEVVSAAQRVCGSNNGFVYAIEPGAQATSPSMISSTLSYQSPNLGRMIMGLDVGELDHGTVDGDQEIACGGWIDTGDFVDWTQGNLARNRAHLYLLDPDPSQGKFIVTTLDGDDLLGTGKGLGSGIFGVKIDDVDGDGTNEIWCCDAVGHIYLFRYLASLVPPWAVGWNCVYRSGDLGIYPGFYNNLFPIKGGVDGRQTVKLAVVSPGYVMAFGVDPSVLP